MTISPATVKVTHRTRVIVWTLLGLLVLFVSLTIVGRESRFHNPGGWIWLLTVLPGGLILATTAMLIPTSCEFSDCIIQRYLIRRVRTEWSDLDDFGVGLLDNAGMLGRGGGAAPVVGLLSACLPAIQVRFSFYPKCRRAFSCICRYDQARQILALTEQYRDVPERIWKRLRLADPALWNDGYQISQALQEIVSEDLISGSSGAAVQDALLMQSIVPHVASAAPVSPPQSNAFEWPCRPSLTTAATSEMRRRRSDGGHGDNLVIRLLPKRRSSLLRISFEVFDPDDRDWQWQSEGLTLVVDRKRGAFLDNALIDYADGAFRIRENDPMFMELGT